MKKQIAVSTIVMLGAMAMAQDSSTPISVRLGLDYPVIAATRSAGNEFYGFGLQRKVSSVRESGSYNSAFELSADYYGRGNFRHIPILLNYVGYSKKGDSFWSIGGGFGFVKRPSVTGTESIGRFAYQAGIGVNLSSGPVSSFLELKFFGSEATEVNVAGLYYGVRF